MNSDTFLRDEFCLVNPNASGSVTFEFKWHLIFLTKIYKTSKETIAFGHVHLQNYLILYYILKQKCFTSEHRDLTVPKEHPGMPCTFHPFYFLNDSRISMTLCFSVLFIIAIADWITEIWMHYTFNSIAKKVEMSCYTAFFNIYMIEVMHGISSNFMLC